MAEYKLVKHEGGYIIHKGMMCTKPNSTPTYSSMTKVWAKLQYASSTRENQMLFYDIYRSLTELNLLNLSNRLMSTTYIRICCIYHLRIW